MSQSDSVQTGCCGFSRWFQEINLGHPRLPQPQRAGLPYKSPALPPNIQTYKNQTKLQHLHSVCIYQKNSYYISLNPSLQKIDPFQLYLFLRIDSNNSPSLPMIIDKIVDVATFGATY